MTMEEYLKGNKLYGDDFSPEQIETWYKQEAEAYADLGSKNKEEYSYGYHEYNNIHGFQKLKHVSTFENALGLGSAWGFEFEPIIDKIKKITIIEPSDNMISNKIGNVLPKYVKPTVTGELPFEKDQFDLITCFGTLHHMPNVTYSIGEMIRVLKPNGYLLIREPIISMGDWRQPRQGLTRNERGIPIHIFDGIFAKNNVEVVSKGYCFTMSSYIQRLFGKLFKKPIYSYKGYVLFDKYISMIFKSNVHYHPKSKMERLSPQSVFYVIKKRSKTN